jgi:hypothetical protein
MLPQDESTVNCKKSDQEHAEQDVPLGKSNRWAVKGKGRVNFR